MTATADACTKCGGTEDLRDHAFAPGRTYCAPCRLKRAEWDRIHYAILDSDVYDEIRDERGRAHAKHGDTSMEAAPADDPTGRRYRILAEEVGEIAREFNDAEHDGRPVDLAKVRKECIQVAAMAAGWADAIPASGS